ADHFKGGGSVSEGFLMTDEVMKRVFETGLTVDAAFNSSFTNEAINYSRQIFFIDYLASNYARFSLRLLIAVLFLMGFLMLAVPTLTTSFLILSSVTAGI
ncbi:MAG: hypothetical protein AB8B60_01025, partial [Sulfitobacter sp.]